MKIVLLHGPGEVQKRGQALKIRRQFPPENTTIVDFKQDSLKTLQMQLISRSFFDTSSRLIVVENSPDNLDLTKLSAEDENLTLLLIGETPKNESLLLQTAKKVKAQVGIFEGEKELTAFPFIDSLIEQKKEAFLQLDKLLDTYGGMYVLAMIFYLLRRNILPLPPSSFMQNKINSQKRKYNTKDWQKLYKLTLLTEFKIKSGLINEVLALHLLVEFVTAGSFQENSA